MALPCVQLVVVAFCSATVFLRTRMGTSTLEGTLQAPEAACLTYQ